MHQTILEVQDYTLRKDGEVQYYLEQCGIDGSNLICNKINPSGGFELGIFFAISIIAIFVVGYLVGKFSDNF